MATTIKDVARIAGVSIATVSKVINNSPTISEKTVEKVHEAIKSLNYVPNERARSFSRKFNHKVAFITKIKRDMAFYNPHLFEIMSGAQQTLHQKGFTMEFFGFKVSNPDKIKNIVDSKGIDGIILHASLITPDIAKYLVKSKFPHVVIGMPNFPNGVCWIDNNNNLSGQLSVKHLLSIDKEDIAYIGGGKNDLISELRLDGIKLELEHNDLIIQDDHIIKTDSSIKEAYRATERLLNLEHRPDAIICANNVIDLGCLKALNDHHIKVPEEVAVITFDDYPYATITNPPTTAINIDVYDLGQQASRLLLEKIKKPNYHFQTYMTVPLLVTRKSTIKD